MKQTINLNSLKILNFFKLTFPKHSLLWLSLFETSFTYFIFSPRFLFTPPFIFIDLSITKQTINPRTHVCTYPRSLFHSWSQKANTSLNRIMAGKVALRDWNVSYLFRVDVSPRFEIFNGGHGVNYYGSRMYERKILNEKDLISWGNIIAVSFRNLPPWCQVFLGC